MKKTLLAIFGGRSTEHEISCKSVVNIVKNVDPELYDVLLVGITKEGRWLLVDSVASVEVGSWYQSKVRAMLLPDTELKSLLIIDESGEGCGNSSDGNADGCNCGDSADGCNCGDSADGCNCGDSADGCCCGSDAAAECSLIRIDVIFPALHGKNGEDGTIQGLFELAQIPYVGCGVLASAVSMDKLYTKIIAAGPLQKVGVRQAKYVAVVGSQIDNMDDCVNRVEKAFAYPVFVKPSNAGSSCGVTKAHNREELMSGLRKAYEVDRKILVEETIVGREVECAVFRGADGVIKASGVGEILAAADFYDYDAKYNNPQSETDTDPDIDPHHKEQIRTAAKAVFNAVDGYGLARVDFFLTKDGPVFNELNTLPGFTAISMYPMLWEAEGISKKTLIQDLIDTASRRPGFAG